MSQQFNRRKSSKKEGSDNSASFDLSQSLKELDASLRDLSEPEFKAEDVPADFETNSNSRRKGSILMKFGIGKKASSSGSTRYRHQTKERPRTLGQRPKDDGCEGVFRS